MIQVGDIRIYTGPKLNYPIDKRRPVLVICVTCGSNKCQIAGISTKQYPNTIRITNNDIDGNFNIPSSGSYVNFNNPISISTKDLDRKIGTYKPIKIS